VIADVMLGSFELEARDDGWFEDRAQMKRVVDAIVGTPLGPRMKLAGVYGEPTPAATPEQILERVAVGRDGMYGITDAHPPQRVLVALTITRHDLLIEARVLGPELIERRTTVLDDLAAIAIAVRECGSFYGLSAGWIRPKSRKHIDYVPDRERPPVPITRHDVLPRSLAVLELIDVAFHGSTHPLARPGELELARAPLPDGVRRDERDGLVVIRWTSDVGDKAALDRACDVHDDWVNRHLPQG
jgi:hypothetical protein